MTKAPADVLEIFLQPGDFYFGEGTTRIRTLLGSCVAIAIWHPALRLGGMSHYMLPQRPARPVGGPAGRLDGRYADDVFLLFHRELQRTHTRPGEYLVRIFGGGRMFQHVTTTRPHVDICQKNIDAAHRLIARHGFGLHAQDLGGQGHRNVGLDLWSGDVWLRRVPLRATL